jgi:hypothetical protein
MESHAFHDLLELCKKGIRWYDQGLGHGHYEFHLDALEYSNLFDALKILDGKAKKPGKADIESKYRDLRKKMDSLNEVLAPFIFHGKALKADERDDSATVVSQKDSSYLCVGAFRHLMEEVDPVEFRLLKRKRL